MKFICQLFLVAGLLLASRTEAAVIVVVNTASAVASLSHEQVRELWLGSTKSVGDLKADLCDQAPESSVRAEFYQLTTKKSVKEMMALWSKLVFTGRGIEPKNAVDDDGVVKCVKDSKGGIGYLSSGKAAVGVKTVLTLQ